jgi:hypothetical protein
MKRATKRM